MSLIVENINLSYLLPLASRSLLVLPTFTGLSFLVSPRTLAPMSVLVLHSSINKQNTN